MCKKFLSLLLSLIILVGAVGVPVEADDSSSTTPTPTPTTTIYIYKTIPSSDEVSGLYRTITANTGEPYALALDGVPFPTSTGYTCSGWTTTKGSDTKLSLDTTVAAGNVNLYPIWEANTYPITYYGYNNAIFATKDTTFGEEYQLPDDEPTRSGYKFTGWFTAANRGSQVTEDTVMTDVNQTQLYAQWTNLTYKVTWSYEDPDGKTINGEETVTSGTTVGRFITKPSKTGYNFVWSKGGTELSDSDTITEDTTLVGSFKAKTPTVTLNANGGKFKGGADAPSNTVAYGGDYKTIITSDNTNKLERPGYNLTGWALSSNGTNPVTADSKVENENNHSLFAQWTARSDIALNFDVNAPSDVPVAARPTSPPSTIVTYDQAYGDKLPTLATLTDNATSPTYKYTFDGWYEAAEDKLKDKDDPNSEEKIYSKIEPADVVTTEETINLHARWKYEVEFYNNYPNETGTETPTKKTFTTGTMVGSNLLAKPTKEGYNCDGWYTSKDALDTQEVSSNTIANPDKDKKIYAKWSPKAYKVTFDANGGKFAGGDATAKQNLPFGKAYSTIFPAAPTRPGYTFDGWYTDKDGDTKVKDTDTLNTAGPVTLYAHWKSKPYTVTLNYGNLADNSYKPPVIELKNIYMGASFAGLPDKSSVDGFEKDGVKFTFYNWYTKAEGGNMVNSTSTLSSEMLDGETVTLYARWNYDVEFYYNNTTAKDPKADTKLTFTTGAKYDAFPTPTYTGKTLLGWFTEKEGGTQVSPSGTANGDIFKLYAHWTTSTYVITLDVNGGTPGSGAKSWPYNYGDTYGSNITDSNYYPIPPAGHSFDGWYTEAEGGTKVLPTDKVTQTCTLYAHWKPDQFKITLELNYTGSTGTVKTVDYGTKLADILTPDPERTGFAFDGWFTEKECENLVDKEQAVNSHMTLYAKWTKAKRVELVVGGGTLPEGVPAYVNLYEGGVYRLPTPTWLGCDFDGWYTAETGGTQIQNGTPILTESSIPDTLYARWTPKKVRVNFNYNGSGTTREPKEYPVGSKYTLLPNAMWAGYKFMGWYTKPVGGDKITADTVVSVESERPEDLEITIYAHWGYTVAFEPGEGSGSMDQEVAEINQPYTLPTCTFTPPDGMRFGGWAIGTPEGATQPGGSQYTVTRNLTLYATWTTAPIVITSSCTSGGSLMTDDGKANSITVERGEDVTFVATANTGYVLKDLVVDGVSFNYTDVYTFRNVIEDHTIHAVFEPIGAPSYTTCDHGNSCPLSRYSDLDPDKWYHNGVHYCIDNVIMSGSSSTRFNPGARSSRGEIAVSLWNNAGRPEYSNRGPLANTYPDVKPSDWYYQAIEWATDEGFLTGYGSGRFGPADSVTREQLVTILWRHAGRPRPRSTTLRFNDASQVSNFAWEAMCWATEQHILQGRSTGYLVPKGTATRAEVATMLMNYLG